MTEAQGRILVVDDDVALTDAIVMALAPQYHVSAAYSGAAAIGAICDDYFDLVLLDHRLPDLLGTDLLRLIKRFFPSTTVVLMTGQGSEDVAADALRGGARDYLRKPFHLGDLLARVASVFALRREGVERRRAPYLTLLERGDEALRTLPEDLNPDRSRSVLRAIAHIEAHFEEALTLGALARLAGMSPFHFCRQFKRTTGLPFRAFLLNKRVARAKELLRDSSHSVGDVARAVGFRDLTHFGRAFRKIERVLPSEFRRRVVSGAEPPTRPA